MDNAKKLFGVLGGQCQKHLSMLLKCIWWTVWRERNSRCFGGMGNQVPRINMNSLLLFHFWCKEEPLVETVAILEILEAS